jgi:hypothetical protein
MLVEAGAMVPLASTAGAPGCAPDPVLISTAVVAERLTHRGVGLGHAPATVLRSARPSRAGRFRVDAHSRLTAA